MVQISSYCDDLVKAFWVVHRKLCCPVFSKVSINGTVTNIIWKAVPEVQTLFHKGVVPHVETMPQFWHLGFGSFRELPPVDQNSFPATGKVGSLVESMDLPTFSCVSNMSPFSQCHLTANVTLQDTESPSEAPTFCSLSSRRYPTLRAENFLILLIWLPYTRKILQEWPEQKLIVLNLLRMTPTAWIAFEVVCAIYCLK